MKILIADDNERFRALLHEYLPASCDEIFECGDGAEAVSLFREHRPDWVLMDLDMPRMNGLDALRRILDAFPDANVCMVTAYDDDDVREAALAAGAGGFVAKGDLSELDAILAGT